MLLQHLTDDELFNMIHLMNDRSKEPIKTYLRSMLNRDPQRTVDWLSQRDKFSEKATEAFVEVVDDFQRRVEAPALRKIASCVFTNGKSYYPGLFASRIKLINYLNDASLQLSATEDREVGVRAISLSRLVQRQGEKPETWNLVQDRLAKDVNEIVRINAMQLLAKGKKNDPRTWELMKALVVEDRHITVRIRALQLFVDEQGKLPENRELVNAWMKDSETTIRKAALAALIQHADSTDTKRLCGVPTNWIRNWDQGILIPYPWRFNGTLDPLESITHEEVKSTAKIWGLEETEVKKRYERLHEDLKANFAFQLKLDWRKV